MQPFLRGVCISVVAIGWGGTALAQKPALQNGDFEKRSTKKDAIEGFEVSFGAQNGGSHPPSEVELDAKVKHGGKYSLKLAGDQKTRGWRVVEQQLEVRPGATYKLTGFTRTQDIVPGFVKGTQIAHFRNCHVGIFLLDGNGEIVAKDVVDPDLPTCDWKGFHLSAKAPDSARKAIVNFFLSMPGELWVDDLELTIEGGEKAPEPKLVFREDFAKASSIPSAWKKELGARNGDGPSDGDGDEAIAIDSTEGADASSPRSLHLTGDSNTIRWYTLGRIVDAAPGNVFRLKAKVKAKEVRKEGVQFANLHVSLAFEDKAGNAVGVPRFVFPGDGSYDWKEVLVQAVAPLDTAKVRAGLFLSMSGDVWIDDVELTFDAGGEPPYAKWLKKETRHLTLRYSPDPGVVAAIPELAKRLDPAYEEIRKALAVDYKEKITMYVYRDNDEGQPLVGRELDFAEPDQRTVHQTVHSTLSHEMTHCIARAIGYAQTGLFGEGLAVYFNGAPPEFHHQTAAKLLADGKLPSLDSLLKDFRGQENSYPAAGSFCGFVIETFGIEKFKTLYLSTDPAAIAPDVLGAPLADVEAKWRTKLKTP